MISSHSFRRLFMAAIALSALATVPAVADPAVEATMLSRNDRSPIRYQVRGNGAPAVVFIHCWMGNAGFWDREAALFSDRYRVVTLDLPGHGRSGKSRKKWTMAAYGQDVQTVVEKLGLDKVILVGHSMGGYVMVEAARRMPKRVTAMVAIDTLQDAEHPEDPKETAALVAALRKDFPKATADLVKMISGPKSDPAVMGELAAKMGSGRPAIGIALMQAMGRYDLAEGFRATRAPLVALNSPMFPTNVEGNRKYLTSFELRPLPDGVGHFPQFEAPAAFDALLEEVIAEIAAAGEIRH